MKVFVKKLATRPDAENPDYWIPADYEKTHTTFTEMFREPEINECFEVGTFRSSLVEEIIDEHTFKTINSIYHWEII